MDYFIGHWQEIVSLGIVAATAVLLIRSELQQRKKHTCSSCSLADPRLNNKFFVSQQ
ncbi:MAG: hypothetical protein AB1600_08795 [Bacteroidota bacterium]